VALDPAWSPFVADPRRAALFVDLDGSLAPIVVDPASAVPLPAAVDACARLAARLGRVAVVSGRPVAFVRRHLPDPAIVVVGEYGLEIDRDGVTIADPRTIPFEPAVAAAAAEAGRRWPRLTIERKGTIAVTIHWRTAPDAAPTPEALADLAEAHGLARVAGRMACELLPPLPIDKGTAVAELLAEDDLGVAAFAGDDLGDLAAFVAVHRWGGAAPGRIALRVAVASEESPPELLEAADLVVDGPLALAVELGALADAVS
jgi:trehalose 6-phosphate phosphatase